MLTVYEFALLWGLLNTKHVFVISKLVKHIEISITFVAFYQIRTDNAMAKRYVTKGTNNDLQTTIQKTKDQVIGSLPRKCYSTHDIRVVTPVEEIPFVANFITLHCIDVFKENTIFVYCCSIMWS